MIRLCDIVTKGQIKEAAFLLLTKNKDNSLRDTFAFANYSLYKNAARPGNFDSFFGAVLNLSCAMQCWSTGARVSALGSRLSWVDAAITNESAAVLIDLWATP